jgi:CRISPR system Cascade subunit CasD
VNPAATATLLLRLAGPMQSWGLESRFDHRDTGREPTKSGVLGLICAALGKPRDDRPGAWPSLPELVELKMGVRVLREGTLCIDYQTAGGGDFRGRKSYGVWKASGSSGGSVVSPRHYLADADFLVGLEGTLTLLRRIEQALHDPVWPMYLGRKSYVPTLPVTFPAGSPPAEPAVREASLAEALETFVDSSNVSRQRTTLPVPQRLVLEAAPDESTAESRQDVPLSFRERAFAVRGVKTRWLETRHE